MTAFGLGVWLSGTDRHPLRIAGAVLIAHGIVGFFWPPMHQREVLAAGGGTLTDTLHIAWTFVTVVLMMLAIGFSAVPFGKWFRIYSAWTMVLLVVFGAFTGIYAPRLQANLPTPWIGVWERIDISLFMVWVVVLAVALLADREWRHDTSRMRAAVSHAHG